MKTIRITGVTILADHLGEGKNEEEAFDIMDAINDAIGKIESNPVLLKSNARITFENTGDDNGHG